MTIILAAALALAPAASGAITPTTTAAADAAATPGWHDDQTLTVGGGVRWFRYYVPRRLARPAPVVVLLHGGGQSMRRLTERRGAAAREWPEVADDAGFLLLVPNGVNASSGDPGGDRQTWNDCRADTTAADSGADDVGFIATLLDWAEATFPVDGARIYATGASNGGMMCYRLATELPRRIAAVAAFVANQPAVSECPAPKAPVPVMIVNGTEDPFMPWRGGWVVAHRGTVLSTAETLAMWLRVDRAGPAPVRRRLLPDRDPYDGTRVRLEDYRGAAEVLLVTVEGGGHTMPSIHHRLPRWVHGLLRVGRQNRDVEGARLAWDFLSRQRLPTRH